MCLEKVYHALTDFHLPVTKHYGKPFRPTYEFAESTINLLDPPPLSSDPIHEQKRRIYAVGDNLASDILGANMYGWHSILVRTGVFQETDDTMNGNFMLPKPVLSALRLDEQLTQREISAFLKPKTLCDDIGAAVDFILKKEEIEF